MLLRCAQDSPAQLHGPQHQHHQHHHVGISHGQSPLQPAQFGASPLHAGALARTEGRHMHTHSAIADTWRGCGGGGGGGGGAGAPKDPAVAHIPSQVISCPRYTYSQCASTLFRASSPSPQMRGYVNSIGDVQAATMQADCHDMVPPPDEHQLLLLKLLESMPSSEHEQFLGNKLYSLVQVHTTRIY
jgi:hypothetical protein